MNGKLYMAMGLLVQAPGAASLQFRLDHIFLVLEADFGLTTKARGFKQKAGDPFLCPSGINARTAEPFAAVAPTARGPTRLVKIEMGFR